MSSTERSVPLNLLTGTRVAIATIATLFPRLGSRMFRLNGEGTAAIPFARMFGIRNALLAAGLLQLDAVGSPRTFVGINVMVDIVDALALVDAGRRGEVPRSGAFLAGGTALLATGLGVAALAALDESG
ncbi:MAG: hypothetical protein QOH60_4087 [Mycobacterium sp.]|jgi:hypothetical protein|nr:hypothetical protein [Mycobacterium sp.]